MMRRFLLFIPLLLMLALLLFFAFGMQRDRAENGDFVPSHMIGKQLPSYDLPQAVEDRPGVDTAALADGKPKLINLFASWCLPCAAEAEQLATIAKAGVPIYGVAVRDTPEELASFLMRYGNPYRAIGRDDAGSLQLALGASGLPETYLIGADGTILYQHIGDIRAEHVDGLIARYKETAK